MIYAVNKKVIFALLILITASTANAGYSIKNNINGVNTKFTIFGFSQLEARGGKGSATNNSNAISFHAQRIRLGWKYSAGKVNSKVFIDFNKNSAANKTTDAGGASGIGVPDNIKDAFVSYNLNKAFIPKIGVLKMPHGMSFTIPGWNLDIAERGLDKKLVLERNLGVMISGRDIGFGDDGKVNGLEMGHERPWKGFGYDIMIANQAGRSAAVTNAKEGNANSYAARVMFDWTQILHIEASYALSQNAGGIKGQTLYKYNATTGTIPASTLLSSSEDYSSYDIGLDSHFSNTNIKLEYINAHNIKGLKDNDEAALSTTLTYAINTKFEPALKHIEASSTKGTGVTTTHLGNTYIGLNIFLTPLTTFMSRNDKRKRNTHKLVLNYILATGNTVGTNKWNGLGGYTEDAWIFQYQVGF